MNKHMIRGCFYFILFFLPSLLKGNLVQDGLECQATSAKMIEMSSEQLSKQSISLVWQGSFMDFGSLSNVNRAMTRELEKIPQIDLSCVSITPLSQGFSNPPELRDFLFRLTFQPPDNAAVTVRHAWPPDWTSPTRGKWVLMQPWEFGSLPVEWVENIKRVDEVWVPSHFVRKEYISSGVPADKVKVVPNGYHPSTFHPEVKPFQLSTKKKFKFLFLGGTIYRKGPDLLLSSYQKAFKATDDVCLVIKDFGSRSCYAGLTQGEQIKAAQQVSNGAEILYLDEEMSADEIASLYKACDCLVYPYRGEGFALPVLEAMACGLPVVVTDGGATNDFVTNECGWFIPAKVNPIGFDIGTTKLVQEGWLLEPDSDVLSALLVWLSRHPAEVQAKGLMASKKAKEWTWEKSAAMAAERVRCLVAED